MNMGIVSRTPNLTYEEQRERQVIFDALCRSHDRSTETQSYEVILALRAARHGATPDACFVSEDMT
jgi:hypothetical protein